MMFERARALADAVLLEGYCLYPYRASAPKNQNPYRWQFGVLAPRDWSEAGGCEPWWLEAQCLLHGGREIEGALRFLQRVERRVERAAGDGVFEPTEAIELEDRLLVTWDEAEIREIPLRAALDSTGTVVWFEESAGEWAEWIIRADGTTAGRVVRARGRVCGRVLLESDDLGGELIRMRLRVECTTPWSEPGAPRRDALSGALLSTHVLLEARGGVFLSMQDPPPWAADAARSCRSVRTYPVLAGEPGSDHVLLCAPIILYDHAAIAPESPGDFFDATEIDELLALRTATLTTEEKRQARATDARAAAIVDRVDRMPPEAMERLHGTIRDRRDAGLQPGARVRLRPGTRRTDAQDLLYAGKTATIEKVMRDIDGRICLALTIDDDPAAELHRWYGRYHYYYPDEVEVLSDPEGNG